MKKAITWILVVVVIVLVLSLLVKFYSEETSEKLNLETPEAVDQATEEVTAEIDQISVEEAEMDATLNEMEALSF